MQTFGSRRLTLDEHIKNVTELGLDIVKDAQAAPLGTINRLGQCAGTAVCAILRRYADVKEAAVGVPNDLLDDVQELIKILSSIKPFVAKRASRNKFMSVVKHIFDWKRMREYRDSLRRILGHSKPASSLPAKQTLEQIAARLKGALENLAFEEQDNQAPLFDGSYTSMTYPLHGHSNQRPAYYSHQQHQSTVYGNQTVTKASSHITSVNSGNNSITIIRDSNNRH